MTSRAMRPNPKKVILQPTTTPFATLTPERVLDLVEKVLHTPTVGYGRPLPSYINRVYDIPLEDDSHVVAKFYRPGRWASDALQDEHQFLQELTNEDVPVIAPIPNPQTGATLHSSEDIFYALFPKKGGRACEEPTPEEWRQIGRLIARIHQVGMQQPATHRLTLHPERSARFHLDTILTAAHFPPPLQTRYQNIATQILDLITPLFEDITPIRLHGDMHRMNLLWRPEEPLYAIDFDDMLNGPAIQDLWMLLPARWQDARREWNWLLEGYSLFMDFDDVDLRLIEPLRAMRYLHHTAWCVLQQADGMHSKLDADFGTPDYWRREIADLERQEQEIHDDLRRFSSSFSSRS